MTGHFFCVGIPEDLEIKEYGSEGKRLAKWKFGYQRFQTFSETCIAAIETATGKIMCSGEFREREYNDQIYTDANVVAVTSLDKPSKAKPKQQQKPEQESDLPF